MLLIIATLVFNNDNGREAIIRAFRRDKNPSQREEVILLFSFIPLRSWRSYLPLGERLLVRAQMLLDCYFNYRPGAKR